MNVGRLQPESTHGPVAFAKTAAEVIDPLEMQYPSTRCASRMIGGSIPAHVGGAPLKQVEDAADAVAADAIPARVNGAPLKVTASVPDRTVRAPLPTARRLARGGPVGRAYSDSDGAS